MSWVLFTLLAVNFWAISNMIDKHVISKHVKNPAIPMSVQSIPIFIYIGTLVWVYGVRIPDLFHLIVPLIIGVATYVAILLYYNALKHEEVSRIIPLYALTPVLTALLATLFLGEIFGLGKYLGISLLIAGSVLISYKRHEGRYKLSKAFVFILAASFIYAAFFVVTKYLNYSSDIMSLFIITETGVAGSALISLAMNRKEVGKIYAKSKKIIFYMVLSGTFGVAGFLLIFIAISQGPVSLINALDLSQGFFTLFYATLLSIFRPQILKEEIKGSVIALKLLAIAIIFAGAYLVSV